MSDLSVTLQSIHVHPVKSCAGVALREALVAETGLDLDREWMVVDATGTFVSQRELPRLTLVRTELKGNDLVLRAPGMLALHVAVDRVEGRTEVDVWRDRVAAYDMGALCAQWFSDFVGRPLRLARFDPEVRRLAARDATGAIEAPTAFQDGFPLLVVSAASLGELNRRLREAGDDAATIERFRPNLVVDGLDANDEDHVDEIVWAAEGEPVVVKLVKPCERCSIPDVDPATGFLSHAVGDALARYRADPRAGGAITFGMNAIVVSGIGSTLRVGARGQASYRFDRSPR